MRTIILILVSAAILALPVAAQNITRVDDNGNTLYFGLRANKANKYDKVKTPPSYEVIAPLTPAVGKSETVKNAIDTMWVPFVYETIQKYNNAINGTVTVPKRISYQGVNYPISCIGTQAFKDCKKLKKVLLPLSVTEIGTEAFSGCSELTEIVLPPELKKIGNFAFEHCKKIKTIELYSETPPELGQHSDFYLYGVTLIVPPKTADIYGTKEPWSDAKSIVERAGTSSTNIFWTTAETGQKFICKITNQDEGTASIISYSIMTPYIKCDESYDDISGEMKLPYSVTNENIPYNINTLEQNAFNSCDITNVRIPATITKIEKGAFKNCKKLTYVRIDGGNVEIADDAFEGLPEDAVLSVPKLCGSYYKQMTACKKFKEIKEAMSK
ncbi:MAG: leucine-rich repeat protein [Bacteroidales bacterium]|nr:leucine-rich repeat protein [Bacteroidales bacterium]